MKKICLLTDQHICTNPRLWKEAICFSKAGYEVVILTVFTTEAELERDRVLLGKDSTIRYKAVLNLIPGKIRYGKQFFYRARRKLAVLLKLYLGYDSAFLLGYAPDLLLAEAKTERADLYVAHMECSQYVGRQLSELGFKVAFDIEDWYSRDYLVPERPVKLLETLERYALEKGVYVTCPSDSMAKELFNAYSSKRKPLTVYNSFSKSETPVDTSVNEENTYFKLVWFSQTIGPGRGLELLIASLKYIEFPVKLNLIGDISQEYLNSLTALFKENSLHLLNISPQIPHHKLTKELSLNDVGIALELPHPESRQLTVTNKILQYTQAGIRVLASATKGQLEIAEKFPESIYIVERFDPQICASVLKKIAQQKFKNSLDVKNRFNEILSWESQEQKILKELEQISECSLPL